MDSKKENVIVYGLGKEFVYWRSWIEKKYNVLGYADSDAEKAGLYQPFMSIEEIQKSQDNIIITSTEYYDEIKDALIASGVEEKRIGGGKEIIEPPVMVVKIWGGFGGIMTTYSFAKSLQKLNPNVPLYFDMSYYEDTDWDDGKVAPHNIEKLFHIPLISQAADSDTIKRAKRQGMTVEKDEETGVYCEKYLSTQKGYVMGYWPTRKYFYNIKDEIKDLFKFDMQYMSNAQKELLKKIQSTESVAVWIRRGNYLEEASWSILGCICSEDYYNRAIECIKEKHPNAEFYIFSNDAEYIQERYSEYNLMVYSENTSDMKDYDMYLMASCKHMILANSGFSWCAAWLHDAYGNKGTIISPKVWINGRPSSDIWEDSWIRI